MIRPLAALLILFAGSIAFADEAKIRKTLEGKLGGARIEAVQPAPLQGLFEVQVRTAEDVEILYTDETGSYLIFGDIFETGTDRNLTEERKRRLSAIRFDLLPLDLAVKVTRGNGKRVVAVFADPYCPACKQFERVLSQTRDITIYYFVFPVIRPDLIEHSRWVWCAPDRAKAWLDLAGQGKPPPRRKCANPIDKTLELGRELRINSTPTLIFTNGERVSGGLPPELLVRRLDQAAADSPHVK